MIGCHAISEHYLVTLGFLNRCPGSPGSFKFGVAFGGAIALAERFNCPWHLVTPQAWKKSLKLTSDKQQSLDMARQLWPTAPLDRQKDNGRAEALLLAEWLRRQYG